MASLLERDVRSARYAVGGMLPSERALAKKYSTSRMTVRKALAVLAKKKMVVVRPGKGTYVQNPARAERRAQSDVVAIYYPAGPVGNMYFGPVYHGIMGGCHSLAFRAELTTIERLERSSPHSYAGVICVHAKPETQQWMEQLARRGIPVVFTSSTMPGSAAHVVSIDNRLWARRATEYLAQLGHRRIGLLTAPPQQAGLCMHYRMLGYRDGLEASGLANEEDLCLMLPSADAKVIYEQMEDFLRRKSLTALLVTNGTYAVPAAGALVHMGYAIPSAVSVLTFDDYPLPLYGPIPSLTSIRLPLELIGRKAVEVLHRAATDHTTAPICETLPAELVVRESCRALQSTNGRLQKGGGAGNECRVVNGEQ